MFDPEFDRPSVKAGVRHNSSLPLSSPQKPIAKALDLPNGKKLTRKERQARLQNVERDNVLVGIDRPLPKQLPARQVALQLLVTDKILLNTGAINFVHPVVAAWVRANGKKSKVK